MHYIHLSKRNYEMYFKEDTVKYKKYFYVLRGILASRFILVEDKIPPILFDELLYLLPENIRFVVNELLDKKKTTNEIENASRIQLLDDYIENEIEKITKEAESLEDKINDWGRLDRFFLDVINN